MNVVHRSLVFGTTLTASMMVIEAWVFFILWSQVYQSTAPDLGFLASTVFTMIITAVTGWGRNTPGRGLNRNRVPWEGLTP